MGMAVGGSGSIPLMRPLTPSSICFSRRQMEQQLLEAEVQLENFTSGLSASFDMMRCQADAQAPPSSLPGVLQNENRGEKGLNSETRRCQPMAEALSSSLSRAFQGENGKEKGLNFKDLREKAVCCHSEDGVEQMVSCLCDDEKRRYTSERRLASSHDSRPSTRGSR